MQVGVGIGNRLAEKLITGFFDILAFNSALAATFWFRYKSHFFPQTYDPAISIQGYVLPALILTFVWLFLFFFTGLYRDWYKESRIDEFFVVSRTIFIGIFALFLLISADEILIFAQTGNKPNLFSKTRFTLLITYAACILIATTVNRFAMHTLLCWIFSKGIWIQNLLIIGASEAGTRLVNEISTYPHLGYRIIGFIDTNETKKGTHCANLPIFGTYVDLPEITKKHAVSGVIISHVPAGTDDIMQILNYLSDSNLTIYMVPSLMDIIAGHLKTHQIFGVPLIVLLHDHIPGWQAQIKRCFDIGVSFLVLIAGSWLWVLIAFLIRVSSSGPAIFKQERIGKYGKPFIMMKFRSMYQDAEQRSGPTWAQENDPRITPIGRFLRKTRLDEIPQFINVLKGEMSLVGPRPERAFFIERLKKEIPWYIQRIKMKPGITGWAQVKHKYDATIEDVKQKVLYDLYYFENMSLLLDLKIIVRTLMVVITGKGAR